MATTSLNFKATKIFVYLDSTVSTMVSPTFFYAKIFGVNKKIETLSLLLRKPITPKERLAE